MDRWKKFVQTTADGLRLELTASKASKVLKQMEVMLLAAAEGGHNNDDGPSPRSARHVVDIPQIFKRGTSSAIAHCLVDDRYGFTTQQLMELLRLASAPYVSHAVVQLCMRNVNVSPLSLSMTHYLEASGRTLTHLSLTNASIGDDCAAMLLEGLSRHNATLVSLDLSRNHISYVPVLAQLLVQHASLRVVDLSFNHLGRQRSSSSRTHPSSRGSSAEGGGVTGFVTGLAAKLEQRLGSHNVGAAAGPLQSGEAGDQASSRLFLPDDDAGDNRTHGVDGAVEKDDADGEPLRELLRCLLRPHEPSWPAGRGWASSIVCIRAIGNGVTDACVRSLIRMVSRDCENITDRARDDAGATEAHGDSEQDAPVTSANAHLFVPAVRLAQVILCEAQVDCADNYHAATATAQPNDGDYDANGATLLTIRSLDALLKRRQRCLAAWYNGEVPGDGGVQSTAVVGNAGETVDNGVDGNAMEDYGLTTGVVDDGSVGRRTLAGEEVASTNDSKMNRDCGVAPCSVREPEASAVALVSLLQCELAHQAVATEIVHERCLDMVTLAQGMAGIIATERLRQADADAAAAVKALGATLASQSDECKRWEHAACEAQERLEKAHRREEALQTSLAEAEAVRRDVVQQVLTQMKALSMDPPMQPPVLVSVGSSTDLQMVDIEAWRREKMRRRLARAERKAAAAVAPTAAIAQEREEGHQDVPNAQPTQQDCANPLAEDEAEESTDPLGEQPPLAPVGALPPTNDDGKRYGGTEGSSSTSSSRARVDCDDEDVVPDTTNTFQVVLRVDDSFAHMTKAQWQRDADVTQCTGCSRAFGVMRRKHHCRRCGAVACDKCAPKSVMHNGMRICKTCTRRSSVAPSNASFATTYRTNSPS